jgi:hypothetical protein
MPNPPLEKVEEETRLLEKVMLAVPGFRGYKAKELRREADRLVRDSLYRKLETIRGDFEIIFRDLSDNRLEKYLDELNHLIAKIDTLSERINHASYGYSGFYDAMKIEEDELDNMLSFDSGLLEGIAKLNDETATFKFDISEGKFDTASQHITTLTSQLEELEKKFDGREETIKGVGL